MRRLSLTILTCIALLHCSNVFGDTNYFLNSMISNTDETFLLDGRFVTDGTVGENLKLGDILVDWEITISENDQLVTLTMDNSSIIESSFANFTVTTQDIMVLSAPFEKVGFTISLDDSNGYYSVISPSFDALAVLVDVSPPGASGVPLSTPHTIATAIPEPHVTTCFYVTFFVLSLRRRRVRNVD